MKKILLPAALLVSITLALQVQAFEPLHVATSKNDTNAMAVILKDGVDINVIEISHGCASLHWASRFNRMQAAKFLIAQGADVNARDNLGITPVHYAALCGHYDMVEMLLLNKADVNAFDDQGLTPLHMAAQYGHARIVELLLSYGANISAKTNHSGLSPLHWAAFWGHTEAIRTLIEHGADINAQDNCGYTALTWAEQYDHYDMARLLARCGCKKHEHY